MRELKEEEKEEEEEVYHVKVRQPLGPANRYLAKAEKWGGHDCDMLAISYRSNARELSLARTPIE